RRSFFFENTVKKPNHCNTDKKNGETQPFSFHKFDQRICVTAIHFVKILFGNLVEFAPVLFSGFHQICVQHRCQRKRNKGRYEHRRAKHNTKFTEKSSHKPLQKYYGKEYSRQRNRNGNYGEKYFLGTFYGRFNGRHSLLYFFVNVFRYHNPVIHHQTCGEHNCQKREHVYAIPEKPHNKKCCNQRNGNVNQRAQCHGPISEEKIYYKNYQHDGNSKRFNNLNNCPFYKNGIVSCNIQFKICRKLFFQFFIFNIKSIGDIHIIGSRLRNNGHRDHWLSAVAELG